MANSPAPDKLVISLRIPRELMARLDKMASSRQEPTTRTVIHLLDDATENISLTSEEYEQIARDTEAAIERKRRGHKPTQAKHIARKACTTQETGSGAENES